LYVTTVKKFDGIGSWIGETVLGIGSVIVKMIILILIKIQKWKRIEQGDISNIYPGVALENASS
jgi:hypothetical protein